MSTIVCLKDGETLILGTDSRYVSSDLSTVASDAEQKIFQVAPQTFIAPSGWKIACDFQRSKARELAVTLRTTDVRVLATELAKNTVPRLKELAAVLGSIKDSHEKIRASLDGRLVLHTTLLAGRTADGALGYVTLVFRIQLGRVVCESSEYFGETGQLYTSSGDPAWELVRQDPSLLDGGHVEVVQKFLAALKQAWPSIGGPDQIVRIDSKGAGWVNSPPVGGCRADFETGDALFAGQATFAYSGGGKVTINSLGITLADNNSSPLHTVAVGSGGITIARSGGGTVSVNSTGVSVARGGFAVTITSVSVVLQNGSGDFLQLDSSGLTVSRGANTLSIGASSIVLSNGPSALTVSSTQITLQTFASGNTYTVTLSGSSLEFSQTAGTNAHVKVSAPGGQYTLMDWASVQVFNAGGVCAAQLIRQLAGNGALQLYADASDWLVLYPFTSNSASAGSRTLPSQPAGFFEIEISGVTYKVPYYNS